jgi:hypothetical protein
VVTARETCRHLSSHDKEFIMNTSNVVCGSLLAAALASVALPVSAQILPSFTTTTNASGYVQHDDGIESGSINETRNSRIGAPIEVSHSLGTQSFEASASASAGTLRAAVATEWAPAPVWYNENRAVANASAGATDYFLISGGTGVATAGLRAEIDGRQTPGAQAYYWESTSLFGFSLIYNGRRDAAVLCRADRVHIGRPVPERARGIAKPPGR